MPNRCPRTAAEPVARPVRLGNTQRLRGTDGDQLVVLRLHDTKLPRSSWECIGVPCWHSCGTQSEHIYSGSTKECFGLIALRRVLRFR